jgi:Fe2+ transport system protein FeoA
VTLDLDKSRVKVLIHTKAEDGYPPEEWEGLWAIPLGGERFQIDNIPFYAKNLSCDDIIEAGLEGNKLIFRRLIQPSENSTIRIVVYDLKDETSVRRRLLDLGCSIEGTGTPGLIAINVPRTNMAGAINFLNEAVARDELDFEEGALR